MVWIAINFRVLQYCLITIAFEFFHVVVTSSTALFSDPSALFPLMDFQRALAIYINTGITLLMIKESLKTQPRGLSASLDLSDVP